VGVATQNPRFVRGLEPTLKSTRLANYVRTLRRDLLKVSEAIGVVHPGLITPDDVDLADGVRQTTSLRDIYGYQPGWGQVGPELADEITALMVPQEVDSGQER
jgi:glutamate synthase (ferredoxin)